MYHQQLNKLPCQVVWLRKLLDIKEVDSSNSKGFLVFVQNSTEWLLKHDLDCYHEDNDYGVLLSSSIGYIVNCYKGVNNLSSLIERKQKSPLEKVEDKAWYLQHICNFFLPINKNITLHTSLGGHVKWFKEDRVYVIIDDSNLSIKPDKGFNEKYVYLAAWLSYENNNDRLIKKLRKNLIYEIYLKSIKTLSYQDNVTYLLNQFQNKFSWLNLISLDFGFHLFLLLPDKYRLNSFLSKVSYLLIKVITENHLIFTDMLGRNGWGYFFLRLRIYLKVVDLLLTSQLNNALDLLLTLNLRLNVREQLLVV